MPDRERPEPAHQDACGGNRRLHWARERGEWYRESNKVGNQETGFATNQFGQARALRSLGHAFGTGGQMLTSTLRSARSRREFARELRVAQAFALAACVTVLGSSAGAQKSQLTFISSYSDSASASGEGVGSPEFAGVELGVVPAPAKAAIPTSPASGSQMLLVAVQAKFTSEICLEKIPSNFGQGTVTLPDAPSAYVPLSAHCKLLLFTRRAYSPYTFATAAFEAGIAQMSAEWPQYGGGMQGWGKRYGATLADTESRRFIQTYLFSTILHQDPRYFPSTQTSLIGRAWYAATRVLITRGDTGRTEFNTSEMLGALSTSLLQNAYYPQHYRSVDATVGRFTGALSSDATSAILREFTPDLKLMFNRHCPKKIKRFEARLPLPEDDKP